MHLGEETVGIKAAARATEEVGQRVGVRARALQDRHVPEPHAHLSGLDQGRGLCVLVGQACQD